MTTRTETSTGFGPRRKTMRSAQREADNWNNSGDGAAYQMSERTNVVPPVPAHTQTITAHVEYMGNGEFACAYVTTREFEEN